MSAMNFGSFFVVLCCCRTTDCSLCVQQKRQEARNPKRVDTVKNGEQGEVKVEAAVEVVVVYCVSMSSQWRFAVLGAVVASGCRC